MQSTWRRPQSCRRRLSSHNAPLSFLSSFNGFLMEDLRKVELVLPDSLQTDGILGKKKKGGYWSSGLIKQDCQFLEHTVTGTGPLQHHATSTSHHRVDVQLRGEVGVSVGSNNNLPRDDGISFGGNRPFWEHTLRRTSACPHTWEGPAWPGLRSDRLSRRGGGLMGGPGRQAFEEESVCSAAWQSQPPSISITHVHMPTGQGDNSSEGGRLREQQLSELWFCSRTALRLHVSRCCKSQQAALSGGAPHECMAALYICVLLTSVQSGLQKTRFI